MSITINGATNTLTAASGLTIAGNTAVIGTLSATDNISTTKNQNGATTVTLTNTTSGTSAQTQFSATDGTYTTALIRYNASHSAYGQLAALDGIFYNNSSVMHFAVDNASPTWKWSGGSGVASTYMTLSSTGLAVTGTLSASGLGTFSSGAFTDSGALQIGADIGASSITNATRKFGAITTPHYTNAQEKVVLASVDSDAASTLLNIGGGSSSFNSPTAVYVYAQAAVDTGGGSVVGTFSSTGLAVTGTLSASSNILPTIDNTSNLGSGALGMKELFSDNGTINTSDARRKTEVSALSAAEINAAKQLAKEIGSFKFLAAVAEKGDAARLHIGMTVQRAIEIMEANGLNPFAYSFICHDAWDQQVVDHPAVEAKDAVLDDEGNVVEPAVEAKDAWTEVTLEAGDKYSFRVHELLLFMSAGFEARLSALEAA